MNYEKLSETREIIPRGFPMISTFKQSLLIIVSPHVGSNGRRHPSDFDCWLEGGPFLCISRQPFLQAARVLKAMGHHPDTTLVMRHAGSDVVALRGRLGIAAGLTVDEYNGTRFAPWKPFLGLAGSSAIEKSQQGGGQVVPSLI
jgi:hypothetical protein